MRNIKLVLEYDGAGYQGWQRQKRGKTVQAALEDCILRLTGRKAVLRGAGRTDAGVHALGQVASFRTASELDTATIKRALNALLPPDIRVRSASEAAEDFHPRFSPGRKTYRYLIANADFASPFISRYVWRVPQRLDVDVMKRAARHFVGEHDFRAFMGSGSSVKGTVREVYRVRVEELRSVAFLGANMRGRFIRITVSGNGFLRHMVRNIVGTLVEVARGKISPGQVGGILASGDRRKAGPTAPANGLFLQGIVYYQR